MEDEKLILVSFRADEILFYDIVQQHCAKNGIAAADYIKDLIKKDLAWGQFAKRRKPADKKTRDRNHWKIDHQNKK